jgi:DNA-binding IclR family transcriptional regulator
MGLDAIAAPIFGADGEMVAALDLSGPSHRLRNRPERDRLTKEGAAELSRRLGYRARRSET